MRMWMVDPHVLCRKHLLGEHVELHMLVGSIRKGISLGGYVKNGLVDTRQITTRHDSLSVEILRRGMRHNSPLPEFTDPKVGLVDAQVSLSELKARCAECAVRIKEVEQ